MMNSTTDLKAHVTVEQYFLAQGSTPNSQGRWRCLCPSSHHNGDASPSVTIKNGTAKCWSQGCFGDGADIFAVVGVVEHLPDFRAQRKRVMELAGIYKANGKGQGLGKIVATYDYTDEAGTLLFQVVRFFPKTFRQRRPDGNGGWIWNLKDTRLVLYRLPDVLTAHHILIVEGEKDVETAYTLGLPPDWTVTCNPMGAGKWRTEFSNLLEGKQVLILPDADEPGRKHGQHVAQALMGRAKRVALLSLPEGVKDLSGWAEGKSGTDLTALLTGNSIHAYRPHPPHESNFHPVSADQLLSEPPEEIDWVLEDYLPVGGLGLLAGKPKEGKTTIGYELAVKVALGLPFLGRQTRKGAVLILALEEHAREVRMRLRNLGASELPNVFLHIGPLEPTATTLNSISAFAQEHCVCLILIDTLSTFWKIDNENDAAEMTRVIKPLLALPRNSGACVLLIHHARKSEGSYGDEIRGSGALFAAVDVALILKRHEVQNQRLLQAQSRYPETPSELVLELRETGYVALGDPASTGKHAKLAKLAGILPDSLEAADTIAKRAGLSQREGHRLLGILVKGGKAFREGKGVKNDPYRFRRNSIHAGGQPIGHESNSLKPDSIHAAPPSPCTNGIVPNVPEETGMTKIPTPQTLYPDDGEVITDET